ncbi:MAG: NAD(P)-dependent oxidoreductase [Mycobacterium sp.]|nr:NAD(P)-dependent oxidoreductase [Mycobacterium sp.]
MNRLAVTGGAGRIGTALRPLLRAAYRLRLLDVRELPVELADGEDFRQLDVGDLRAMETALLGMDAVVHLAGQPSPAAGWSSVLKDNIDATRSVFEAARRNGIGKVVFASTNHVAGFYNLEGSWPIDTQSAIRPDSLYGVSKALGEALARYYSDAFDMSIICLRIGWFTPRGPSVSALNPLWISARDLAQVVQLSLETSRRFGIYNATSNNPQAHWDLRTTREELGYAPRDDVTAHATDTDTRAVYVDPRAGVLGDSPPGT